MALAAKKDRKYFGLANMGLPEHFTPYHAYGMLQCTFEEGVLDPKDFKARNKSPPIAIARPGNAAAIRFESS